MVTHEVRSASDTLGCNAVHELPRTVERAYPATAIGTAEAAAVCRLLSCPTVDIWWTFEMGIGQPEWESTMLVIVASQIACHAATS